MNLPGYIGFSADWKWHFLYQAQHIDEYHLKLHIPKQHITTFVGQRLNLCLPFIRNTEFFDQCEIQTIENSSNFTGKLCHRTPLRYTLHFDSTMRSLNDVDKLFHIILKDAVLTKRAIRIYFEHLIPFFSKLSLLGGTEHNRIETDLADKIYQRLSQKINVLKELSMLSLQTITEEHIAQHLLCSLTEIEESDLREVFSALSVPQYIRSIRLSEHKLAINHNSLVTLKALTQHT